MPYESELQRLRQKTYQGRPVVTVKWKGEDVEAVEGLVAYRTASKEPVSVKEAADGLRVEVLGVTAPRELGIGVISSFSHINMEDLVSAADRMGADVLWTEPVLLEHGSLTPNDARFADQWSLATIKASRAWDVWNGDASRVVLAVLDSGIPIENGSLSHPDLNDASRFFLGRDLINQDDDPADDHGHGTHVAGIAAATTNNSTGIAGLWPGQLLVLKVFDTYCEGDNVKFHDGVLAAVKFAKKHEAHLVINYSGGGPDSDTKKAAIQHANDNGALIVAAAGNAKGGRIDFPAAYSTQYSNVMAVGAVNNQNQRPAFASRGPEMTVVAPGVGILSCVPNYYVTMGSNTKYDLMDGTSQATALAAGLAALVWSKWPQLSAAQVRDKIVQSADPISGPFDEYGHGLINAEKALT